MTESAIEAVGLSKRFLIASERRTSLKERLVRGRAPQPKSFWALKNASFSVPKGSSLGLIGQNGSGKSTALKVLTGIYRPTSGNVSVNGSVSALLEVGAGFHPELTGRENVRLNATILGFTNREIDRFMSRIIEFADIGDHIDGPIKHYSSGMYVRLGFAVAVMVRPEILLVDEVIAVGDEEFQRKCFDYLYDLRRSGTSMIIVSHGLGQITDLCDDAVWLQDGSVADHGPSRKVVKSYLEAVNEREVARSAAAVMPGTLGGEAGPEGFAPVVVPDEGAASSQESDSTPTPDRSVAATGLPHRPVGPRRGSGEIRVVDLILLNEDSLRSTVLISGRPGTFVIEFEASEEVHGPIFGLGFDNAEDYTVAGINNSHLDPWTVPQGRGRVMFEASPLLLAAGTYRIRVQVHVLSHVLDAVDGGFPLAVRAPDVEIDGAFLQPGGWTLDPGPQPVGDWPRVGS